MVKKYLITAIVFLGIGLALGVFFREFTKYFEYDLINNHTSLSAMHVHALVLGFIFSLVMMMLVKVFCIEQSKIERVAYIAYVIGLSIALIMMLIRGILQVVDVDFMAKIDSALAGIAGLGHILLGLSLVLYAIYLFKGIKEQ